MGASASASAIAMAEYPSMKKFILKSMAGHTPSTCVPEAVRRAHFVFRRSFGGMITSLNCQRYPVWWGGCY
jgi:hypothetical protein